MKKVLISIGAIILTSQIAGAQTLDAVRVGIDDNDGRVTYTIPQTTLEIEFQISHEAIRKGPYARFSQKYLGVIAPLTDKDIYTIKEARIGVAAQPAPLKGDQSQTMAVMSYVASDTAFLRVSPDKMMILDKSPEDMAAAAANTIYTLRKRRIELISGDIGENVYGAGLTSALREIDRIEQEYLSLFMGKVTTTNYTQSVRLTPDGTKSNYVVARFTDNAGIVGEDNLSGRPLVLEVRADRRNIPAAAPTKGAKSVAMYRIPELVSCRIMDAGKQVASVQIPMLQYGSDHQVAR